ncbi:hypothetical protein [Paenibacillus jiagnxiensis]|uniref:hypothetical protein n=1 Tax=Paenibacillus jiagnxiensis TaxID=3228926 RepID=UPI0033BCF033
MVKERENPVSDDLITERDIDEEFGLFKEDSFPAALVDRDQKDAQEHGRPDSDRANLNNPAVGKGEQAT